MAAISALQHNPDIKIQNLRLLKNGKSKMSAHLFWCYKTPKTLSSSSQLIIT